MAKQLTEYYERQFNHFIEHVEEKGCTCASYLCEDICGYCSHEGNMTNLHDNDEAWEDTEEHDN